MIFRKKPQILCPHNNISLYRSSGKRICDDCKKELRPFEEYPWYRKELDKRK